VVGDHQGCRHCGDKKLDFAFTMAFQPIVDLQDRRIDAYEALVRGPQGEGADYVFSRLTAENRYAFDQACRVKAIEMAAKLRIDRTLNINFLPNMVYEPEGCLRQTMLAAARTGFPLQRLTFEIVEHEDTTELEHLRQIIATYRHHGFQIALDDYGVGYSGLLRMTELRPDIIKLDRVLVRGCDTDYRRWVMIASLIELCDALQTKIVLEGVETAAEAQALRRAGGRYMQGFYFARPAFEAATPDSAIPWLEPAAEPQYARQA
jgi:EAL domain-containing protein (putative c-di-GMP-specific phosphodiesterase class I)